MEYKQTFIKRHKNKLNQYVLSYIKYNDKEVKLLSCTFIRNSGVINKSLWNGSHSEMCLLVNPSPFVFVP